VINKSTKYNVPFPEIPMFLPKLPFSHGSSIFPQNGKIPTSSQHWSGLQMLAVEKQNAEYLTTAWFISLFNRWFTLMTNRSAKLALSKKNPEAYADAIDHIKKTARVFQLISVGLYMEMSFKAEEH